LKETFKNQKIKRDLFSQSNNIIFKNNLKVFFSLFFILSLILLTLYFIFDFKNDIKNDEKINVYDQIKKLENENKNINNNESLIKSSTEVKDNKVEEKNLEDFSIKLQKYI
jgi:preprotein translocase subunit SecF